MFGKLNPLVLSRQNTSCIVPCRFIRARWERSYLKDLYHRRVIAGADPIIARSAQPNWNYTSEIAALTQRIGGHDISRLKIQKALTTETFYERPDVAAESSGTQPSLEEVVQSSENNVKYVNQGRDLLDKTVKRYLRSQWPLAPEEYIKAVSRYLLNNEFIAQVSKSLGINHVIRTGEFPPEQKTVADGLCALIAVLEPNRAKKLVVDYMLVHLADWPLEDILPLKEPFDVLTDYLMKNGVVNVEPRILRTNAIETAMPYYVVGIYADKVLVGESPGETLSVAVDLAAQRGLLQLWQITRDRLLDFGDRAYSIDLDKFAKRNHSLREICGPKTDVRVLSQEELAIEPLDIVEAAKHYAKEIRPEVGIPLRKRLRHFFSRGTLLKRTRKRMVVPRVFNI